MTADPSMMRRSTLQDRAGQFARLSSSGRVRIEEIPFLTMLNLRVVQASSVAAAQDVLGLALPGPIRAATSGDRSAVWLGPDEWLVVAPDGEAPDLVTALHDALEPGSGSVVDVSANRTTIHLSGPHARDVLEKGVAIDLNPRATAVHEPGLTWSAQTLLTSVPIILRQQAENDYLLLVRPSFAGYIANWLLDAAIEYVS